ncbi:hypothetical protein C7M84_006001 [Penaeus vannamei]|uniref:xylose isomerase n=1 Tax=Penaeus vannamei TaxID=6689 RepID=A0A423TG54_PENVA|nr:hypothetical protein C7M84_006001 [Penaeus vannamei]
MTQDVDEDEGLERVISRSETRPADPLKSAGQRSYGKEKSSPPPPLFLRARWPIPPFRSAQPIPPIAYCFGCIARGAQEPVGGQSLCQVSCVRSSDAVSGAQPSVYRPRRQAYPRVRGRSASQSHISVSSAGSGVAMNKYFPGIGRIEYRPDAGPEDTLVFRHYNAKETVHGRTMEEWLKFSVCYFNTFRYLGSDDHYGERTHQRSWEDGSRSLDNYKRRMMAAFEFFQKLHVKYYSVSDRDMAPEGENYDQTNTFLDEMVTLACDLTGGMRGLCTTALTCFLTLAT